MNIYVHVRTYVYICMYRDACLYISKEAHGTESCADGSMEYVSIYLFI